MEARFFVVWLLYSAGGPAPIKFEGKASEALENKAIRHYG